MTETSTITSKFSTSYSAPTKGINPHIPPSCDGAKCEAVIQIGTFFDGTDNNRRRDEPIYGETNIARLAESYPDEQHTGVFNLYVNGVGTEFPEIGEKSSSKFGTAFGRGGFGRILFAMLGVLNSIGLRTLGRQIYSAEQIKSLCCADKSRQSAAALAQLGREGGLIELEEDDEARENFFFEQLKILEEKIAAAKVEIKECILDVFGFSRGAAQARVFCCWVERLTIGGKLAGIPLTIRFLGIFDTVASAGIMHSLGNGIVNSTGGHVGWAQSKFLRISPKIKTCVHLVAMHEIRKNFPLDEVSIDGVVPENCREFAYPGAHSDIGGGYAPGALGLAAGNGIEGGDALKLSQIPLRHMMECAIAAGVPISQRKDGRFAIAPALQSAYKRFLDISGSSAKMPSEWMAPYMAWRWQVRKQYQQLGHVRRATDDRHHLIDSNDKLLADVSYMGFRADEEVARRFVIAARTNKKLDLKDPAYRQEEISALDPEAPHVFATARDAPPVTPELAEFFDNYVHDSLAGFRKHLVEPTGYWRYRRCFRGDDKPRLTESDGERPKSDSTA